MNTQNECTAPAIAMAAEPNSRPPIRLMRAPVRSMKKPTGVCNTAETMLKVVSRSEEHTSELQSLTNLVCRLLLEKKKNNNKYDVRLQRQSVNTDAHE